MAGELSPKLYSRVDLAKYASGAALLRNFFVDYQGGASTRPGTRFCAKAAAAYPAQPRLIPFVVSDTIAYVLEFGDEYIRFIANNAYIEDGGSPVELASPYAYTDLPILKYSQSANLLTLTHSAYPVYDLRRVSSVLFTLTARTVGPSISSPTTQSAVQANGTAAENLYGYIVTAVNGSGEESTEVIPTFVEGDTLDQNAGVVNRISWSPVSTANYYKVYKVGPTPSGTGNDSTPPSTVYGYIGQSFTTSFIDNNIGQDYAQTPPVFQDPFSPGQIARVSTDTPGTGYTDQVVNLIFTGDGSGASGYAIVDIDSGEVAGAVLTRPGEGYTTCAISDDGADTATYDFELGPSSGTYPATSSYFQQRAVFGGTDNFPEGMVFSQPGAYNNFDTKPLSLATDAITVSLASRKVNYIKALVPMNTGLVVLTSGQGFLVSGGSPEAAITPTDITALPQASSGANDLPPLVINYDILYGQFKGACVRDLAFNWGVQSYTGTDRSVLASHLFKGQTLSEWAWAEEPHRLVHLVREDGTLLLFTYVPEQEIFAWTRADTFGFFRSVCSIPEGNEDAVYYIVQRKVLGDWGYYIERLASREYSNVADAWCVDCALATAPNYPAADIEFSGNSGTVSARASTGIFALGDVGKTIWAGPGQAEITAYVGPNEVTVSVLQPFDTTPNDPDGAVVPYDSGEWQLLAPVTVLTGLDHLEGQTVSGLGDGMPILPQVVTAGSITLPTPASKHIIGLAYQPQLQTLRLNLSPDSYGKRKHVSAVTAVVNETGGLSVGPDFDHLTTMKDLVLTYPPYLVSNDARTLTRATWTKEGQVCFQQDLPLPATILGVIPEVLVGDNVR